MARFGRRLKPKEFEKVAQRHTNRRKRIVRGRGIPRDTRRCRHDATSVNLLVERGRVANSSANGLRTRWRGSPARCLFQVKRNKSGLGERVLLGYLSQAAWRLPPMVALAYEAAAGFRSPIIPRRLPSESRIHMSQTSAWGSLAIRRGS